MAPPDRTLPVAVFDSGVGGLTVLHECLVSLPHEDFLYLGDTARFPYGDRSRGELLAFARELAGILLERGAKLLVVACNSATAAALPVLRAEFESRLPVVGVVQPESRRAAAVTRNGRVGLLATPATVAARTRGSWARPHRARSCTRSPRPSWRRSSRREERSITARSRASTGSAGRYGRRASTPSSLGCTHYPLVRPVLQRALGRGVAIVSSGEAIAAEVEGRLRELGLAGDEDRRGHCMRRGAARTAGRTRAG